MEQNFYYIQGRGQQENDEILSYLKEKNYSWKKEEQPIDFSIVSKDVALDRYVLYSVFLRQHKLEPIDLMKMYPADIESCQQKAITLNELKEHISAVEKEPVSEQKTAKPSYNKKLVFAKISSKQILKTYDSKNKKNEFGEPMKLSKIILPTQKYTKKPIMVNDEPVKNATLVVPTFTISDDKFSKDEDRKCIGLIPDKEYFVYYTGNTRDDKGYLKQEKAVLTGEDLRDAFEPKEKKKELTQRITAGLEKSKNAERKDMHEQKQNDIHER